MTGLASVIDKVVEAPVFTSFTNVGYTVRKRLDEWTPLGHYDLSGRTVLLTGATSGLGYAAARQLAGAGARLLLLGRNPDKTERVRDELAAESGNDSLETVIADMGDLAAVRAAAEAVASRVESLDVLIHNAGALSNERREGTAGIELTVASQVVGPHLMTTLLLDRLSAAAPGRVLTMSSGGMYTAGLTDSQLQMTAADYKGAEQYARAKRAQVTLNEMWAERVPSSDVVFHALHPGWADTPGVEEALPSFRKVVGPLLRSPEQGADTLVWLAADDGEPLASSGEFWLDRRARSIHKLPQTRKTDTPERREKLWAWVEEAASLP